MDEDLASMLFLLLVVLAILAAWEILKWFGYELVMTWTPGATARKMRKLKKLRRLGCAVLTTLRRRPRPSWERRIHHGIILVIEWLLHPQPRQLLKGYEHQNLPEERLLPHRLQCQGQDLHLVQSCQQDRICCST